MPAVPSLPFHDAAPARRRRCARRWAAALGVVFAVAAAPPIRAWDADRMTAAAERQGPKAVAGVQALQRLIPALRGLALAAELDAVNRFYNERIAFATDAEVWGQLDYWASPLEMMGKGRGDCEDYALGKYFTLLAAGIPDSALRLVYVKAVLPGGGGPVPHMVLAHYAQAGADPSILDNLIPDVRPASARPDLTPVFSFNGAGLWEAGGDGGGDKAAGDPTVRLSPWREVLAKARAEGFF